MESLSRKLLKRGGTSLVLASVACSKGKQCEDWAALCPQITHPAEEIIEVIGENPDQQIMAAAIESAISPDTSLNAPVHLRNISKELLKTLGNRIRPLWPPEKGGVSLEGEKGGLASLAIAFCRSSDSAASVARHLSKEDGRMMLRMSRLASVIVGPHVPSTMKKKIKEISTGAL